MKKIGILTINDYNNYGNRLQNYATQEVLKSLSFTVETIINQSTPPSTFANRKKITRFLSVVKKLDKTSIKEIYLKIYLKLWKYVYKDKINDCSTKRIENFKNFTASYISETKYSISENNIPNDLSKRYDYFVTGSDQVWNPVFRYGSEIDFLTFAPHKQRIAYSPSFGISEIPIEYIEKYKTWLSEMHRVSVRESAGAKIIKDLTGSDVPVLVDPTLMLTKEQWISISKAANNKPQSKYLLTYFLGSIPVEYKSRIRNIAKENNLQIVNLADIKDGETFITGPSEFIDYIHSTSVFCTDSFHGVVFSILMETPFIVFDRAGKLPSMNSRIDTLLTTFKLHSRLARNIINKEQVFEANYSHVAPILEVERKKALEYLKEALEVKSN